MPAHRLSQTYFEGRKHAAYALRVLAEKESSEKGSPVILLPGFRGRQSHLRTRHPSSAGPKAIILPKLGRTSMPPQPIKAPRHNLLHLSSALTFSPPLG